MTRPLLLISIGKFLTTSTGCIPAVQTTKSTSSGTPLLYIFPGSTLSMTELGTTVTSCLENHFEI